MSRGLVVPLKTMMLFIRKITNTIIHPNRFLYEIIRKKLGFKRYFVTDKLKVLTYDGRKERLKLPLKHPLIYLYYKINEKLGNPVYPVLVKYRLENTQIIDMGGG